METGVYKIYFRIPFTKYFIAKDLDCGKLRLMFIVWDEKWGNYRWKECIF